MKKIAIVLAFLFLCGTNFANAATDWSFCLESTDNLTWELSFIAGDEGNALNFYFIDLEYDTAELDYASYLPNYSLYGALPPLGSITEPTDGYLKNISGTSFADGYVAAANEEVLLGTLSFTEISSVVDGVADVNFYFDSGYFGIKIDGETYGMGASDTDTLSIALNEEGHAQIMATGTIATPVPAAVWLLGSGLMGLLGIRRKMAC